MIIIDNTHRINNNPTCIYTLLVLLQRIKIISYSLLVTTMKIRNISNLRDYYLLPDYLPTNLR